MTGITKRHLMAGALALPLAAGGAFAAQADTLTVAGSGGGLAQVMDMLYDQPFTEATGIQINALATTDRASALQAMMRSGNTIWDVAELSPVDYAIASTNGWLVPIDWSRADPDGLLPDEARLEDAAVVATYSTILAVRSDRLPEGQAMQSWADFWDVETFPGPRGLQNSVMDNLEFALLADGVERADIYDLLATDEGVDRAFAMLDEIKPHITAWWTAGAQPVQMLADGEVAFTSAWNGRITQLQAEGVPADMIWQGGALKPSYMAIIRGTDMEDAAHEYLRMLLTDAERAAQFAELVAYPAMLPQLYDHLSAEAGANLPTHPDNMDVQFVTNALFWAEHMDRLRERWDEWMLE
ncbi:MAG: ABC transporter substrate-binding protein [Pararhodobacter sp.]|nr:ABC transporter substrate-binding protein [Pararhodobacter sp.]